MEKRCGRCKTYKPLTEFTKDKNRPDGKTVTCKECKRDKYKEDVRTGKRVYVPVLKRKPNPRGLTAGFGVNDADYTVRTKTWTCPFYSVWSAMLHRAYKHTDRPTYEGCSVCDEWRLFSDFKKWMVLQTWEGLRLDKDILIDGNKVYSPDTCAFVPNYLNVAVSIDRRNSKHGPGIYIIGKKFVTKLTVEGRSVEVGRFKTKEEAVRAYRNAKAEAIEKLLVRYRTEPFYSAIVEDALLAKISNFKLEIDYESK